VGNKDLGLPGEAVDSGEVIMPASYNAPCDGYATGAPRPMATGNPSTVPMNYISGVNGPQYGMPMCGTPIGLPGPPHVPLGIPAGLQKHVIKNHTRVHMPKPTRKLKIDVKQTPGMSYPKPVNHVKIHEHTCGGVGVYRQPLTDRVECIRPGCVVPCDGMPCDGIPCDGACYGGMPCEGGECYVPEAQGP
jgi:hypothetical protein